MQLLLILLIAIMLVTCGETGISQHKAQNQSGEGIFLIDLADKSIVQLVSAPNFNDRQSLIKFSYLANNDGSFDFSFVSDNEGNLYHFKTYFTNGAISSSNVSLKLRKNKGSFLNGPAFCRNRRELGFGEVGNTFVGLKIIGVQDLRQIDNLTVEESELANQISTVQSEDFQISTDLVCGNLKKGLVYNGLNCSDSVSVNDCLSVGNGKNISSIQFKALDEDAAVKLTFPERDLKIIQSPNRPPETTLGDNGPTVFVARDGSKHLMFERLYTTEETFNNPNLAHEFKRGGFDALYYKHIEGDPRNSKEYEIDFSQVFGKPIPHSSVLTSDIQLDPARPGWIRFAAFGVFKAPHPVTAQDEDVFVGILTGGFEYRNLSKKGDSKIVLDPTEMQEVLTFAGFTCHVWDEYGMAPNDDVFLYALFSPYFLKGPKGKDYIAFSTAKGFFGKLKDGFITQPSGITISSQQFYENICHKR